MIKEANEAVNCMSVTSVRKSNQRRSYTKFSPEQPAAIIKYRYLSLHGNQAAIRNFSNKQLGVS